MSRSRKKHPIIKDSYKTSEYWGTIRQEWKRELKKFYTTRNIDDLSEYPEDHLYLRNPKEIHNDWDFIDWNWYIITEKKNGEIVYPTYFNVDIYRK